MTAAVCPDIRGHHQPFARSNGIGRFADRVDAIPGVARALIGLRARNLTRALDTSEIFTIENPELQPGTIAETAGSFEAPIAGTRDCRSSFSALSGQVVAATELARRRLLRPLRALSIAIFCISGTAEADFAGGWNAYVAGNYNLALEEWLSLAEEGHSGALLNIGVLYEKGLGVDQDAAKAMEWFRKAADKGEIAAYHNIGVLYRDGRGVPQDHVEAAKWFLKAAENGDTYGRFQLGLASINGLGVPQNISDGVELIRKAADGGNPLAALELAKMHRAGRHVAQDTAEAVKWFKAASAAGSDAAAFALGTMYAEGYGFDVDLVRAYAWFWVAVRRGGHSGAELAIQIVAGSLDESDIERARQLGNALLHGNRVEDS